jgi:L-histidine Nalpha-methyltransferase / hercynylcysteine S-oxide synthase
MASHTHPPIDIVDARRHAAIVSNSNHHPLHDDILKGLAMPAGQKTLPTMLLYDERGLRLYDAITTDAPEYYLFAAEGEILKTHSTDIAQYMHAHNNGKVEKETVIELGAG